MVELNHWASSLSPYRFEACTHHQVGSCTPYHRCNDYNWIN